MVKPSDNAFNLAGIVEHNDSIGRDYRFWSPSFNIHFGYWSNGLNPFDREAMLAQMNEEVLRRLQISPDSYAIIVDAGCGAGATCRYIATKLLHAKFFGISLAPRLLDLGKKMNEKAGLNDRIELFNAGFQSMPLPDACADAAFCLESACYAEGKDKAKLISELHRILKPGGRLVVVDAFRKHGRPFPYLFEKIFRKNARLWAVKELPELRLFKKTLTESGFENVQTEDISWRAIPSALHIPFVVTRLLWNGTWRRNNYWKALLLSLGIGLGMRHVGYYFVSGKKREF